MQGRSLTSTTGLLQTWTYRSRTTRTVMTTMRWMTRFSCSSSPPRNSSTRASSPRNTRRCAANSPSTRNCTPARPPILSFITRATLRVLAMALCLSVCLSVHGSPQDPQQTAGLLIHLTPLLLRRVRAYCLLLCSRRKWEGALSDTAIRKKGKK